MKNHTNSLIVLLAVTAVVLAGLLAMNLTSGGPAYAGASARGGDYIMLSGAFDISTDFIYVVDVPGRRLVVYAPNIQKGSLDLVDSVDLAKLFSMK